MGDLGLPPADAADQRLGVVGDALAVRVAAPQVLGPHARAVGRLPPEARAVDRGRHAPPHDCVLHAREPEQLRHLRDVTEHVGQVADVHGAAELRRPLHSHLEVADKRLTRHEELVGERVPRPHRQPARPRQPLQHCFTLRAHGEVVVDHRHLAVEQEAGVRGVGLEPGEKAVEQVDEAQPEGLEGRVPLPVPVGVGDDRHEPSHTADGRTGLVCDCLCALPARLNEDETPVVFRPEARRRRSISVGSCRST